MAYVIKGGDYLQWKYPNMYYKNISQKYIVTFFKKKKLLENYNIYSQTVWRMEIDAKSVTMR